WILRCLVFLPACLVLVLPVMASWTQRQKITSTPRGVGAQFGNAVALNGNTMVVGARFDGTTASQAGAAYVFVLSGGNWTQQAVLLANDGAVADKFGYSVAISENTIVVGSYNDDSPLSNAGSAYVYVRSGTTWTFQQKLTASDATADDEFGNAVGIVGETIVVGAHFADLPGNSQAGSAYVYRRSGTVWTQTQKLIPVSTNGSVILGDHFGESVAMSSMLAIGAAGDDTPFTAAGAVYVFAESGGSFFQQQKINIASGANGDSFGNSVAIEGNTLVGGALQYTPIIGQPAYGAAYVYEFNGSTWISQGRIVASDGATVDRFGYSVAVSNNVVAVGAREDDTTAGGPDAGSAYIFTRSGSVWTERQKLAPNDTFNGDRFGGSVALSFGNLVVGAAEKALSSPNGQGAVYYFTQINKTRFDFDGDGLADISIFRPLNGQWWYQQSSDNVVRAFQFGTSSDKPVPADYDGDGKTDHAIYRPSTGEWFILRSSNLTFFSVPFGISTDKPAPGDFDGDGLADVAVFRASEGVWYISKSSGGTQITQWGGAGDVPMNADYDGDGKSDLAIFRPSDGSWWLNRSAAGVVATTFGVGTDKPVPADYTGDGKDDIAVWRPGNGSWYILRSEDSSFFAIPFGANGDIPAAADYDGDGKADFAIFRPDGANWFIQRSTAGILIQQFGATGDLPTQASFVP
ncbi:MAG TPA: FG-GAP-like repeat-containing protein, partial [Pyrinomonadaceae bacterium]|nr:FG-GAP-like repeat-containing protein [Pyrinomonadaceae bacterium]